MITNGEGKNVQSTHDWLIDRYTRVAGVALAAVQAPGFDPIAQHEHLRCLRTVATNRLNEAAREGGYEAVRGPLLRAYNHYNHAFELLDRALTPGLSVEEATESLSKILEGTVRQCAFNAWEDSVYGQSQLANAVGYDTHLLLATGVIAESTSFDHAVQVCGAEAVLATLELG